MELVLHVLSHLESTAALPSTLFDPAYVAAAREHLGCPERRALGTDLRVLSACLTDHVTLSAVQLVARLHPSLEAAKAAARYELAELPGDGADLQVRDALLATCAGAAELVRGAALLEAEPFMAWPLPEPSATMQQLAAGLKEFSAAAPLLKTLPVELFRALGSRGRAWPDAIWIGFPSDAEESSHSHVLTQAAHEATVLEVRARANEWGYPLGERAIEQVSVALLARRLRGAPARHHHERWLARMAPEIRAWTSGAGLSPESSRYLDSWVLNGDEGLPDSE